VSGIYQPTRLQWCAIWFLIAVVGTLLAVRYKGEGLAARLVSDWWSFIVVAARTRSSGRPQIMLMPGFESDSR
jgi:hypothetical protein